MRWNSIGVVWVAYLDGLGGRGLVAVVLGLVLGLLHGRLLGRRLGLLHLAHLTK